MRTAHVLRILFLFNDQLAVISRELGLTPLICETEPSEI